MSLKEQIDTNKLPKHIAIIMDGNGRWAKLQNKERIYGHHHGVQSVRDVTKAGAELGIEYITLYAFSQENWNRPKEEVDALMALLIDAIDNEIPTLMKNNVRLDAIGCLEELSQENQEALRIAMGKTKENTRMTLILALSYSSQHEITRAVKEIARLRAEGLISDEDIDKDLVSKHLYTKDLPNPDLLIRTSGEQRLSNYLLWQLAYAELYFTPTLWPDFNKECFYEAIIDFQSRERRFGKTSEQVSNK